MRGGATSAQALATVIGTLRKRGRSGKGAGPSGGCRTALLARRRGAEASPGGRGSLRNAEFEAEEKVLSVSADQHQHGLLIAGQIGRASCRERVCQYV